MSEEKLEEKLEEAKIKQTRRKIDPIRFKDEAINKVKKENYVFGKLKELFIPFIVSKDSHQKGAKLKIIKGKVGDKETQKTFYVQFWFNGKSDKHKIGKYSQRFGVRECDLYLVDLVKTHTDPKTGFWIKDPNLTKKNETRIVEKPDSTKPKGYTINEVIEAYSGASINGEPGERGFSKDRKEGYRRAKSCRSWARYMFGYNHRLQLIKFRDDEKGYGYTEFLPNFHLRVNRPRDYDDLFRKFPPGKGVIKDRKYWNRRKKIWYTIDASQNKSIYDSDIGKSLIHELTPGDIEHFIRGFSSSEIKRDYVKVFISLWVYARKRGWLGTNPGECPFDNGAVYIKREVERKEDPYKNVAMETDGEFELFWKCSEELSWRFPFKSELHQFMVLTAIRKSEALRFRKEFINFDKGTLFIPKGISKTQYRDEELPLVPELEILLRNIMDLGERPGLGFYKMRDFPWLFATRKWKEERYFNREFRLSQQGRLGGDENYIPELRRLMRIKSGDPNLLYAPKILRKSYITLSQQKHSGRSEITSSMSRHASIDTLNRHYNKPNIETKKEYASKVIEHFSFIKRRSA